MIDSDEPSAFRGLIDIVDPQQPVSVMVFGIGKTCHCGDEGTEVELAGGRGRETAGVLRSHPVEQCIASILRLSVRIMVPPR